MIQSLCKNLAMKNNKTLSIRREVKNVFCVFYFRMKCTPLMLTLLSAVWLCKYVLRFIHIRLRSLSVWMWKKNGSKLYGHYNSGLYTYKMQKDKTKDCKQMKPLIDKLILLPETIQPINTTIRDKSERRWTVTSWKIFSILPKRCKWNSSL